MDGKTEFDRMYLRQRNLRRTRWATARGRLALLFFALPGFIGCGATGESPGISAVSETGCASGVAQIAVFDGFQKRLCGCQESPQTYVRPPTTLQCTVTAGTVVFFHFIATRTPHQLLPVGLPRIPASGTIPPERSNSTRPHAFLLDQAGTYRYEDAYLQSLNGEIIVL